MSASGASLSSSCAAASSSSALPRKCAPGDHAGEDDDHHLDVQQGSPTQRAVDSYVQLHRHALESIFACLDIAGLAIVLAVSRDWQAAVGSMRSIDHSVSVATSALLSQVAASRLRRHVLSILLDMAESFGPFSIPRPATLAHLSLLSERMPHLLKFTCSRICISAEVHSIEWPPQLQELTMQEMLVPVPEANMLLQSVAALAQLRSLMLTLRFDASLSFASFTALPLLRVLQLNWTAFDDAPLLSDEQVDQLRALIDLESFSVPMSTSTAMRLLRPPLNIRWQQLSFTRKSEDCTCALLPHLRFLSALSLDWCSCTHFDFLPRMQSLTKFSVGLAYNHPAATAATQSLVSALQQCPRLTSLTLIAEHMPITSELLTACLSGMPALSSLGIKSASLPSLSFLSVPSLALSLRDLSLQYFQQPRPDVSQLRHIHSLKSLRKLTLLEALADPLDDESRALLQVPSTVFPSLIDFTYCHDEDDMDDQQEQE